jgi:hypothetical protein
MEVSFKAFTAQTNHANMLRARVSWGAGTTLSDIRRECMEGFLIANNGPKDRQHHEEFNANSAQSFQGFEYLNLCNKKKKKLTSFHNRPRSVLDRPYCAEYFIFSLEGGGS